jgi:hypothetical protein
MSARAFQPFFPMNRVERIARQSSGSIPSLSSFRPQSAAHAEYLAQFA